MLFLGNMCVRVSSFFLFISLSFSFAVLLLFFSISRKTSNHSMQILLSSSILLFLFLFFSIYYKSMKTQGYSIGIEMSLAQLFPFFLSFFFQHENHVHPHFLLSSKQNNEHSAIRISVHQVHHLFVQLMQR